MANGYNYAASGISGAGTGASTGAAFGPYGAAIGGGLGLVAGLFGAAAEEDDKEARREILDTLSRDLDISYNEIEQAFDEFYKMYIPGGTQKDAIEAASKIRKFDKIFGQRLEEYGLNDPESLKFSYDKTVNDFLDPYMGNVIDASNAKVQHSAAGAGLGRSTGAAKAISENTAREYDRLYNTALNQYNTDRSQAYNEFQGYLDNANKMIDTLTRNDQWGIAQQKQLGDDFLNWQAQIAENKAGMAQDKINTKTQIGLAKAGI
jgi:hypothetical protein